jgi:hypothetical protein
MTKPLLDLLLKKNPFESKEEQHRGLGIKAFISMC